MRTIIRLTRPLSISHNGRAMIDRVSVAPIGLVYRSDACRLKSLSTI